MACPPPKLRTVTEICNKKIEHEHDVQDLERKTMLAGQLSKKRDMLSIFAGYMERVINLRLKDLKYLFRAGTENEQEPIKQLISATMQYIHYVSKPATPTLVPVGYFILNNYDKTIPGEGIYFREERDATGARCFIGYISREYFLRLFEKDIDVYSAPESEQLTGVDRVYQAVIGSDRRRVEPCQAMFSEEDATRFLELYQECEHAYIHLILYATEGALTYSASLLDHSLIYNRCNAFKNLLSSKINYKVELSNCRRNLVL